MDKNRLKTYAYDWLKKLKAKKQNELEFYPLQIANCRRIEKNDAVYIFDEVGTGKTISSGLMAAHYIYDQYDNKVNQPDNYIDACVISINSNIRDDAFKGKWDMIFGECEWKYDSGIGSFMQYNYNGNNIKIKYLNNHYSNIENMSGFKIGVLVIDEAHMFVGGDFGLSETRRLEALKKLKANKIIYLTATPIKYMAYKQENGIKWIKEYNKYNALTAMLIDKDEISVGNRKFKVNDELGQNLADTITSTNKNNKEAMIELITKNFWWVDNNEHLTDEEASEVLDHIGYVDFDANFSNTNNGIISEKFDDKCPITRYFKNTVLSVRNNGYVESKIKRNLAEIKTSNSMRYDDKAKTIVEYINSALLATNNYRFIIFVRTICEEKFIEEELKNNGYIEFLEGNDAYKSYAVINSGENTNLLNICTTKKEKKENSIPRVLIITYQMAEAGLDFPSYSHIINFHISAYPSSLEQRFGRVDRLDIENEPVYENITMVYIVSNDKYDTYRNNFLKAIDSYLENLNIINFPVKNVLFDKNNEVIEYYNGHFTNLINYYKEIEEKIENDEENVVLENYKKMKDGIIDLNKNIDCVTQNILDFLNREDIYGNDNLKDVSINKLKNIILNKIREQKRAQENKLIDKETIEVIKENSDKTFYYDVNEHKIKTVDPKNCAQNILDSVNYKEFVKFYNDIFN